MKILVINAGSSSIKFQLFDMPGTKPMCSGLVEKIGSNAVVKFELTANPAAAITEELQVADHKEAMQEIIRLLTNKERGVISSAGEISVIGHRIVHGGEQFRDATIISDAVKEKIRSLFDLAPLHNPVNYACLELAEDYFPDAKQVAVFDTAFHQTIPEYAYRYAIPSKYYRDDHIRVYGFHGTSHKYIVNKAREFLGFLPEKLITVHLGNGCSIAAVSNGKCIDTSMGFGPLSGLVMGTRSGDIDPAIIFHLSEKSGMPVSEISELLNKKSGMMGMAGSNDMRDIRKMVNAGDSEAILAVELYVYRIKKYIGSYAAALNGLDALLFTAGVGENDTDIRRQVCSGMDYLGISLDEEKNLLRNKETREIQVATGRVKVMVVPTNEELEIAEQAFGLVGN